MNFSERIKSLRQLNGLTQAGLAEAINVSLSTISAYEAGKQSPNSEIILKICKKYEVSADWLLGLDEVQNKLSLAQVVRMLEAIEANTVSTKGAPSIMDSTISDLANRVFYMLFENEEIVKYFRARAQMLEMVNEGLVDFDFYFAWRNESLNELERTYDKNTDSKLDDYRLILESRW